ncbi:hypothetical protein KR032_000898, partial [Drosophila birchii]
SFRREKVRKVSKRHLIVALRDRSDANGKISTFDGARWLNMDKILKLEVVDRELIPFIPKWKVLPHRNPRGKGAEADTTIEFRH